MKKNKGFTIVELVVTISVMLLLMVVVVVAVNAISAKNKEKALLEVKKQTITAAKEFFINNEYYSEDMQFGSELVIGVGRLVDEDYMNVVTNPVTGKKMNKCDKIVITKTSDGEYNYEFQDSNDPSCELDNIVTLTEPGAPAIINLKSTGTKTEKDYYTTDVKVSFFVDRKNNGEISEVKTCTANGSCDPLEQGTVINLKSANDIGNDYEVNNYKMSYNSILKLGDAKIDGNTVTISIIATNTSNKKATAQIVYKKDTVAPSCSTYASSDKVDLTNTSINRWTNKNRTITQKCTDGVSGCNSVQKTFATSTEKSTIQIKDGAGNTNNCNLNVYVDKDAPVCGTTTGEGSTSTWTNQNRTITQNCSDKLSGCNASSYTQNFTTSKEEGDILIYDKAGNETKCTVKVYVDKGVPSATVSMYKNANSCGAATTTAYTSGSWYNKNVHTKVNVTNTTISGIKSITYTLDNAQAVSATNKTICNEGQHTIKYTVCNNAGTCSTTGNYFANIDRTNPVVKVEAYKGAVATVNGLDTLDKVNTAINNKTLSAYGQNTWTNNSIVIKPSFSDNASGLKTYSCTDSRQSSDSSLDSFKTFRRVQGNWTGNFSFNCTVTDNAGNTASLTYNNVKRDVVLPTCFSNDSPSTWTKNKSRTITQKCTDSNSGCKLSQVSKTFTTEGKNGIIQIEDNAGNKRDCSVAVLMDWTVPSCGSADGQGSTSSWINKYSSTTSRTITQKCSDNASGCASVTKTFSGDQTTNKITVTDGAGNTKDCTVGVYIDRTSPSCGSADGQGSTSSWINKSSSATSRTITQNCSDTTSNCSAVTKSFSGDQKTNTITVKDGAGNTSNCTVGVYIDKTAPSCGTATGQGSTSSWINKASSATSRTITQNCSDTTSNCSAVTKTFSGDQTTNTIAIYDGAGNSNSCSVGVYIDKTAPSCGSADGQGSTSSWTNQNRTITQNCSDFVSGCSPVIQTFSTEQTTNTIGIKDGAGNSNSCSVGVYIDKTKPSSTIKGYYASDTVIKAFASVDEAKAAIDNGTVKGLTSAKWTKQSIVLYSTKSDALSGIKSHTCDDPRDGQNNFSTWRRVRGSWQGAFTFTCTTEDNAGNKVTKSYVASRDITAPVITYLEGPVGKKCGGAQGVYIRYKAEDSLSGVKEVYHFFGQDTNVKSYSEISQYNLRVFYSATAGVKSTGDIARNWAVGNPAGCASENDSGPSTSWCYRNNTAVKDHAGNTATGISSSCSKVGG